jgi:hypothetical protein
MTRSRRRVDARDNSIATIYADREKPWSCIRLVALRVLRQLGNRSQLRLWFLSLLALGAGVVLAVLLDAGLRRSPAANMAAALPQNGRWVATSLHQGTTALLSLPVGPPTVLAATSGGVMRSTDGGASWREDGTGLGGSGVFVLAGLPDANLAWAGSLDGAVYARASGSGGDVTWRRVSPVLVTDPSLGALAVYSLAASPQAGHPLLAGSQGAIFRGTPISSGRGWTWNRVWHASSGAQTVAATSLLVSSWDANLVFASIFEGAATVLISRDGGRSWQADPSGPPPRLPTQSLAAGDAGAHQVFLTTMGKGVWQLAANGRWTDISAGLPQHHAMPFLADRSWGRQVYVAGTMGVGVYAKQGSSAWHRLGTGLGGAAASVTALVPTGSPPRLLAATLGGVYRYVPAT